MLLICKHSNGKLVTIHRRGRKGRRVITEADTLDENL